MRRALITVVVLAGIGLGAWYAWLQWGDRILPPPAAPLATFFVISDNHGPRQVYRELLQGAKARGAEFVVHIGDMVEDGTAGEFAEVLAVEESVGLPVYHVVGNHDIAAEKTGAIFETEVGPLRQIKDVGPARLILLNNADRKVGFPDGDLLWLKQQLQGAGSRYTLVFYHRPFGLPFEALFGDDETATSRPTTEAFRAIIRDTPPAMIFTGHIHTYLPYSLEGVPAYLTGGGGDNAQTLLGGANSSFFHGLLVHLTADGPEVELLKHDELTASAATAR